jgi:hypothetical protein
MVVKLQKKTAESTQKPGRLVPDHDLLKFYFGFDVCLLLTVFRRGGLWPRAPQA